MSCYIFLAKPADITCTSISLKMKYAKKTISQHPKHLSLYKHKKSNIEGLACSSCGKVYAHKSSLSKHIRKEHSQNQSGHIICSKCDRE